jgi:hypothetical protein
MHSSGTVSHIIAFTSPTIHRKMLVLLQALTILTIWLAHAQAVAVNFVNSTLAPRDASLWEIKDDLGT